MAGESRPWGQAFRRSFALACCAAGFSLLFLGALPICADTDKASADAALAKGWALYEQQDFLGARGPFEQALAAYRKLGLQKEEGQALTGLGVVARTVAQYDKALGYFDQALTTYRKLGLEQEEAYTLLNLGYVARHLAQYDKALGYYEKALATFRKLGLEKEAASTLKMLGWVAADLAQYDKALGYFDQALTTYRKLGLEKEAAGTLNNMGWVAADLAQYDKALGYFDQALTTYRKLGLEKEAAGTLNNLGWAARELAQYDKALGYCDQALTVCRKPGLEKEAAGTLNNLGRVALELAQYDKALGYFDQALTTYRKLGLEKEEAETLHCLSAEARELAQYDKALGYCDQALTIWRKLGLEKHEAYTFDELGLVAADLAQYEKALGYYEQSLAIWRKLRLEKEAATTLSTLGLVAANLAQYNKALGYYEQALAIYRKQGVPRYTRWAQANIADVHLSQGRLGEARGLLEQAGDPLRWGRYYLRAGDPGKAANAFEQGVDVAEQAPPVRVAYQIGLGLAQEALGEWEKAATAYAKAVDLIEKARANTPAGQRGSFFEGKDYGFRRLEPYEGLARVLHRLGRDDEAFYWSEHTKARALVEAVARAPFGAPLGLPEGLRRQEDQLTDQAAVLSKRLEEKPGQRQAIEEQLKPVRAELEALLARLRLEYPEYASLRYPQPLHAGELALGPEEVLLAYQVTEPESFAFLVRQGKVEKAFEIKLSRQELESLILSYRAGFASVRQQADLRALDLQAGARLYQLLLAPVLAEVKQGEQVVVVPDGVIGLLPLEVLIEHADRVQWQEGEHGPSPVGVHFVGESRVFSYWQSATAMTTVRRLRKEVGGDRALVVADPVFEASDARMPATQVAKVEPAGADLGLRGEIAESLRTAYGAEIFQRIGGAEQLVAGLRRLYGERLTALVGLDARKGRLKQEPLERYGQMIFATHGLLGGNVPWLRQPALVLSQVGNEPGEDGYLTMAEVMDLKLRAEVVALMACDTGAGRNVGGEGVMAMGRAFQYAGARSVLASLWKAEDTSTNLLTEAFLKEMMAGKDKSAALQAARQRVREAGYVHPFYWANFVLIGEQSVASSPSAPKASGAGG